MLLPGAEDDRSSCGKTLPYSIHTSLNIRLGRLIVICCVEEPEDEASASAMDDVLSLPPVKVHRCQLVDTDHHDLLGVDLTAAGIQILDRPVAKCEEDQPPLCEAAEPVVGDILAKLAIHDLADRLTTAPPVGERP